MLAFMAPVQAPPGLNTLLSDAPFWSWRDFFLPFALMISLCFLAVWCVEVFVQSQSALCSFCELGEGASTGTKSEAQRI
jgi:hypothetical protein